MSRNRRAGYWFFYHNVFKNNGLRSENNRDASWQNKHECL